MIYHDVPHREAPRFKHNDKVRIRCVNQLLKGNPISEPYEVRVRATEKVTRLNDDDFTEVMAQIDLLDILSMLSSFNLCLFI
jgi:hypothetical protein